MLLRLETEKSMVLDKKSGQNRNLKTFIGLQGCGKRSGQPSFFFWIFCGQKEVSDRCTNSLQKKLILKLIQKAAVSGLQSCIRNILSNIPFASLPNYFNELLSKEQSVHK